MSILGRGVVVVKLICDSLFCFLFHLNENLKENSKVLIFDAVA
jgi:hypothetical protein